jgi:ribosomal-protein-serine acetyltransferase
MVRDRRISRPAAELGDDGVALRRWRAGDAGELYRAVTASLGHLTPWLEFVSAGYTERDAVDFVLRCQENWRQGTTFGYAALGPDGRVIGSFSLIARIGPGGLEVGYWLHPEHTGGGVGTRAVRLLTEEAFRVGADRVEIVHDLANVRSGAIPRRLGFVEVERRPAQGPPLSGESGTDVIWRLTPDTAREGS